MTVLSINTWRRGPAYSRRLARIAARMRDGLPASPGLVGVQEVTHPLSFPWEANGTSLLARAMEAVFGLSIAECHGGNLGIIAGPEWQMESCASWRLGRDSWAHNPWTVPSVRYLLEARLLHAAQGWTLPFYTTHLSHRDADRRLQQTERLVSIVRQRSRPADLPPIIAGDFNATRDSDVAALMAQHFELLHADTVDLIWAGRRGSFPASGGSFRSFMVGAVGLRSEALSDVHDVPWVKLAVEAG